MGKETHLEFIGIGDNDQLPYAKVDAFKVCRMGDDYAISFYQLDYQAIVNALSGISPLKPEETKMMPVSKVVINSNTFKKFINELQILQKKVESEKL